jgi:hypothetical protein
MSRFKENMIRQLTRHEGQRLKPCCCGLDEKKRFLFDWSAPGRGGGKAVKVESQLHAAGRAALYLERMIKI